MRFPVYRQHDAKDCGPACLRMIARHYGKEYSLQSLRDLSFITREGVSLLGISDAAEKIGFRTMGVRISPKQLVEEVPLPCIAHWKHNHFVVVYKISKGGIFHIADPAHGLIKLNREEFLAGWISTRESGENAGVLLLLEPTPDFYSRKGEKTDKKRFSFILRYLKPQRKLVLQLILGMLLGSMLQLILPFLTQSIVDKGIITQDLNFIYLVLIAQLVLVLSRTSVDFIRNWILLHLSARLNISLISDYLIKLMKLPIGFFDTKLVGDLMQRIGDHSRIQSFLTSGSLNILFGIFNLLIFSIVLAFYNIPILLIFLLGSGIYFLWISLFMGRRRVLDYQRFAQQADNQGTLFQLIIGMQDIKLYNAERQKRWKWEQIQTRLFHTNSKGLYINQYQQLGGLFFNETKNILVTFFAAFAVVKGDMTLGMLVAVQYIIGQMNSPIDQMIWFFQSAQDARISLERLSEIHQMKDEDTENANRVDLPEANTDIRLADLSYQYAGPHSPLVLKNLNIIIPRGKVTAIVGPSGSGKTTLVKLLLGFYEPTKGEIRLGEHRLESLNIRQWRDRCGSVMQDGYLFWESIAENIALGDEDIDKGALARASRIANIDDFIMGLPLGYNTRIGQDGSGLSQGQKQRILIARAVYKDPDYFFFDEATNALDSENESIVMKNLSGFYRGKTVIIVAHRLSTVRDADQIIVLDKGEVVESGTHQELTGMRGRYYSLVKNQLELGL